MTSLNPGLKYPTIELIKQVYKRRTTITPVSTTHYSQSDAMEKTCRHPRVQVVSRDEDAEYVECLECREIFESSEFRDMDIEAKIPTEEEE